MHIIIITSLIYGLKFFYTANSIPEIKDIADTMVQVCIDVYKIIINQLLPTPAKSHYTFNIRDLSKVFQGILMFDASKLTVSPKVDCYRYHVSSLNNRSFLFWWSSWVEAKNLISLSQGIGSCWFDL